jgi:hypothetical protein
LNHDHVRQQEHDLPRSESPRMKAHYSHTLISLSVEAQTEPADWS